MIPSLEGSVAAADGRRVGFSLTGPRGGLPVVYLHGGVGTPIRNVPALGEAITRLGIRHLSISRPGFAGSAGCPGRSIREWPADLALVADHLGLERFVVVGISSGGPYALAASLALGERVLATGVVSCLSPFAAPHTSPAMPLHLRLALRSAVEHPTAIERVARTVTSLIGTGGPGLTGILEDYSLCCRPWGFDAGEVSARIHLWHGARDAFVPLGQARALIAALPDCRARIRSDDGHFFYRRRMVEVLGALVAAASDGAAIRPLRLAA